MKTHFFPILLLIGFITLGITVDSSFAQPEFLDNIGSKGAGDGKFKNPWDVDMDSDGNIYVSDTSNNRIQKFDSNGNFILAFGEKGQGDGQFNFPRGIEVYDEFVYVVDERNNRIQKFDSNGNFILAFGEKGKAKEEGKFNRPIDIAIDKNGFVYVADRLNHKIHKFDSDGNYISAFGSKGNSDGKFKNPFALALDSNGKIYVVDIKNNRYQVFSSSGEHLLSIGSKGNSDGKFNNPSGIVVDKHGNIYVSDTSNHRIQKFDLEGNHVYSIGEKNSKTGFKNPRNLILNNDESDLLVADTSFHRIRVLSNVDYVLDETAPVVTVPEDMVMTTDNSNGSTVEFTTSALDETDGEIEVTCTNNSNSIFAIGTTTVTCFAHDQAGNLGSSSFSIIVSKTVDETAPVVTVPEDMVMTTDNSNGSTVEFTTSALDETDGEIEVTCTNNSNSIFAIGTTTVTCFAHDQAGNRGSSSFSITVSETTQSKDDPIVDFDEILTNDSIDDVDEIIDEIIDDAIKPKPESSSVTYVTKDNSEIYMNANSTTSKIIIDKDVNTKLRFTPALDNEHTTIKFDYNIVIGQNSNEEIKIDFASNTKILDNRFDGIIDLPEKQNDSSCPKNITEDNENLESCIEIGSSEKSIKFSLPVRIVLEGQGAHKAFYSPGDGTKRTIIEDQCIADDVYTIATQIGHSSDKPSMCYVKVGNDMIIWTSHFTSFGTISEMIAEAVEAAQKASSTSGTRPPPKIDGIGLYKILDDTESSTSTIQNFEKYFPYSMHSYITDAINYGSSENYVKIGQFFEIDKYSTEILPIIVQQGDKVQFQIKLHDKYKGEYIEHVALYFTDKDSDRIEELDTYISFEKYGPAQISDPHGIFDEVNVESSSEFDAYWIIFDVEFSNRIDAKNILVETWHESRFPSYAKVVNAVNLVDPLSSSFESEQTLKIARVNIPPTLPSPLCAEDNSCFDPYEVTIQKGGIVTWVNQDSSFMHAITSGSMETGPNNKFNGYINPGGIFERQFDQTGTYQYYCTIHPWTVGMVYVVDDVIESSIQNLVVSSDSNISGTLVLPEEELSPIAVEIFDGGDISFIEPGDQIVLETKNLSVEIFGDVGDKQTGKNVAITIVRPDSSQEEFDVIVNSDGEYHIPVKLASNWQTGSFDVIVQYDGSQIGNIPFIVKGSNEFGGILGSPSSNTLSVLEDYADLKISKDQLKSKLQNLGWSDSEIFNMIEKVRSIFFVNSPKKQLDSNIAIEDIICNVGLKPVTKISNNDLLCVDLDSVEKLHARGLIY